MEAAAIAKQHQAEAAAAIEDQRTRLDYTGRAQELLRVAGNPKEGVAQALPETLEKARLLLSKIHTSDDPGGVLTDIEMLVDPQSQRAAERARNKALGEFNAHRALMIQQRADALAEMPLDERNRVLATMSEGDAVAVARALPRELQKSDTEEMARRARESSARMGSPKVEDLPGAAAAAGLVDPQSLGAQVHQRLLARGVDPKELREDREEYERVFEAEWRALKEELESRKAETDAQTVQVEEFNKNYNRR